MKSFKIGHHTFGLDQQKTFIIAEIGNNHNGDFERAKELIDHAVAAGADCAKFQIRQLDQVYRKATLERSGDDLSTEYTLDLLEKFELTHQQQQELKDYCSKQGILYMCTPWDHRSVDILESMGVEAYKIASADLTNLPLIDYVAKCGKPMILSTGMSRRQEVEKTVQFLNARNADFVLLHCNSTYPAPIQDINLKYMDNLKELHPLIGYSGHERGIAISLGAVALGACVMERHLTLDRNMEGPDHAASLVPDDFMQLVKGIREIEEALGSRKERFLSQGEMMNRENLAKSLVAATELKSGIVLKAEHIKVRSPGQGISPQFLDELIGKELKRDMLEDDYFFMTDIKDEHFKPRQYSFRLPWGVPVRYHDFLQYNERIQPDLFEFHLSYSDMDLKISDFLSGTYPIDFVVHAPELFEGSHLMDLATPDDEYRSISLRETQRVIDITRELKQYFPKTQKPLIVANVGGFSMDETLAPELVTEYYERFFESLQSLDTEGVEIIPQTMAPFPWHFGGQRYQNMFVRIDQIVHYCQKFGLRMCFDVSHSRLTTNHFNDDFFEFAEKITPYTAHLHLGDSRGVNGEGLQVGEGEIDFDRLGKICLKNCPKASFIPEIWQGHKNGGEGFWIALDRLEGKF